MRHKALKQGNRQDWRTPQWLFRALHDRFKFDLDAAATAETTQLPRFCEDGLAEEWSGTVFINPPYGMRVLPAWMKKAYEYARDGKGTVVCLVPARTDAGWFHEYALKGKIEFIRGRIKFEGAKHNAPFPTCIVIFDDEVAIEVGA